MNLPKSYLSPSQINCFLKCPKKYEYSYIHRTPSETVPAALLLGKSMHAVFEKYLKSSAISLNDLHDFFCETWSNRNKEIEYSKKITAENVFDKAEQMIRILIENYEITKILATEQRIEGVISDIPVLSFVDAIALNGSKKIIEFKTTGRLKSDPSKDYGLQIGTYSMLTGIDDVEIVQLSTTKNPTLQIDVFRGSDFRGLVQDTYKQVAKAIQSDVFFRNTNGWQCNYCDFYELCQNDLQKEK